MAWRSAWTALLAFAAISAGAGLGGCAGTRIDLSDPGEVSGKLMIFWVGEDRFVYYPYYAEPLTYRLPPEIAAKVGRPALRPGAIYTDGGSIPRAVRNIAGLSPWGYGPAYIVHDWLFVAHHCIAHDLVGRHDKRDHEEVEAVRRIDFPLSADILAGVIEALVRQRKVPERALAPEAIYSGVDSIVAKRMWDNPDPASCDPVGQDVIRDIDAQLRMKDFRVTAVEPGTRPPVLVHQLDF